MGRREVSSSCSSVETACRRSSSRTASAAVGVPLAAASFLTRLLVLRA
jgi:hypothetical protein